MFWNFQMAKVMKAEGSRSNKKNIKWKKWKYRRSREKHIWGFWKFLALIAMALGRVTSFSRSHATMLWPQYNYQGDMSYPPTVSIHGICFEWGPLIFPGWTVTITTAFHRSKYYYTPRHSSAYDQWAVYMYCSTAYKTSVLLITLKTAIKSYKHAHGAQTAYFDLSISSLRTWMKLMQCVCCIHT